MNISNQRMNHQQTNQFINKTKNKSKTIYTECNNVIPTERAVLKNAYINTILNHPNNQDPALVPSLGARQTPLPPHDETMLKHVPRS